MSTLVLNLTRVGATAAAFVLTGCIAMVGGIHQDVEFRSDLPNVDVQMENKTCRVPCKLNIRRQWASHEVKATQDGRIVAQGPVYRRASYGYACGLDGRTGMLAVPAFIDGLLFVPGIVDLSMGITEFHPEMVVIGDGTYHLEDPCFDKPVPGGRR